LFVLDKLKAEKSRVRDRFISYSKYSRRGTLFIQKKVGSALTEAENWDLSQVNVLLNTVVIG
jgi:hypothetical protein